MTWTISSYQGAGPILFGMSSAAVANAIGPAQLTLDDSPTAKREDRGLSFPILSYENDQLTEIVFSPHVKDVQYDGLDVFVRDPLDILKHLSSKYADCKRTRGGTVLSLAAGVATTGFHDANKDQKSFGAFVRGAWGESLLRRAVDVNF